MSKSFILSVDFENCTDDLKSIVFPQGQLPQHWVFGKFAGGIQLM
jgi:hypothetical protein